MIYDITLYINDDNPNKEKIVLLLQERYLCKVRTINSNKLDISIWCSTTEEESKLIKNLDKYFKEILRELE